MSYHSQKLIVENNNFYSGLGLENGSQFLYGHLVSPIANHSNDSLSGAPILAPRAAGRAKPMVPSPPEVTLLLERTKSVYLQATIWCWPTSVTKTASPLVCLLMETMTSPMVKPSFSGCKSLSITSLDLHFHPIRQNVQSIGRRI